MPRPTPFDLVFASLAGERFPPIRTALAAAGRGAADRDAFLMEREAVLLIRELRPEEGLGEGMDQLAALVHHAYVHWDSGLVIVEITPDQLPGLLQAGPPTADPVEVVQPFYVQFPERRVWAETVAGTPPEPLDGFFVFAEGSGDLRVLGVFGLHPERMGFSVVEATGPRLVTSVRPDGTAPYSPTLPGGAAARIYSLASEEELLELGWRTAGGAMAWTR